LPSIDLADGCADGDGLADGDGEVPLPFVLNDNIATTGSWPVRLTNVRLVAIAIAISASWASSGCGTTAQSVCGTRP